MVYQNRQRVFLALFIALFVLSALFFSSCRDSRITTFGLEIGDIVISRTKNGPEARPPIFGPGDDVHIRFAISDYDLDEGGHVYFQEDLNLKDSSGSSNKSWPNILDSSAIPDEGVTEISLNNMITLPEDMPPGEYIIEINVRDMIGGGSAYIKLEIAVESL